jgi:hypothetical protein
MLQHTLDRLAPLSGPENRITVVMRSHLAEPPLQWSSLRQARLSANLRIVIPRRGYFWDWLTFWPEIPGPW